MQYFKMLDFFEILGDCLSCFRLHFFNKQIDTLKLKFVLIGLLFVANVAFGQFQYIGGNLQGFWGPAGMRGGGISVSYLLQKSPTVGFGAELAFPRFSRNDTATFNKSAIEDGYEMGLVWERRQSPSLILRYRMLPSNHFFMGVAMHTGIVSERFFADRYYGIGGQSGDQEIPAYYADYDLNSLYLRFHLEGGLLFNLGEKMYMTFRGSGGIQQTFCKVDNFGVARVGNGLIYDFNPISGISGTFQLSWGMGMKL